MTLPLLSSFFKLHYLVSHLMCALVVLAGLIAIAPVLDKDLKRKIVRWCLGPLAGLSLFLCATGLGLAVNWGELTALNIIHSILGFATYGVAIFFFCYLGQKSLIRIMQIMISFTFLAMIAGVLSSVGLKYFTSPDNSLFVQVRGRPSKLSAEFASIIDKKCSKCHDSSLASGTLDFSNAKIFHETFEPFDGLGSPLYQRVNESLFSSRHMPLHGGRLSDSELSVVRRWIDHRGFLLNPDNARPVLASKGQDVRAGHWTFRKSSKPIVPEASQRHLVKNEIDQFVLHSLEKMNSFELKPLAPAFQARRLAMVLTGLPAKISEAALPYDALKKNYLSSTDFTENFGLFWMDLVAFADDDGSEPDKDHKHNSSEYRQYLLTTLNNDPSYFTMLNEQLTSPKGPHGPNNKSLLNFTPYDEAADLTVDSAMSVTFSLALGLDMRCARCHDHPNEPIGSENYYQLASGFKSEFTSKKEKVVFRSRKGTGPMPLPAFLNIFESSKPVPQFNKFTDLAPWLTSVDNGVGFFTARVFVDQVWYFIFGKSLAAESGQFGATAAQPHYIDLLNWLTWDFLEHGTSIKYLMDKMVSSNVFISQITVGKKYDEDVHQVYRPRLLRGENVKDNFTAASGGLAPRGLARVKSAVPASIKKIDGLLRSIHFFRTRANGDDDSEYVQHFGISKRHISSTRQEGREGIDVELFLLNQKYLRLIFERLKKELPQSKTFTANFINAIYQRILSRNANEKEIVAWRGRFADLSVTEENLDLIFRVLFSSNEFLYIP